MAAAHSPLVVNLTGVAYLDSAGMALLFEQARRGPLEVVVEAGALVGRLVELSGLAEVATVRT